MTKERGDHYDDSTDLQNLIIMSNTCMSSENKISLELQVKGGELCQRTRKGPAMVFIHLILQVLESVFFFSIKGVHIGQNFLVKPQLGDSCSEYYSYSISKNYFHQKPTKHQNCYFSPVHPITHSILFKIIPK